MSKADEILERQRSILEAIRSGENCTKDALMQRFGKNGKPLSLRSLNSDIEALRKQGFAISSKKGKFILSDGAAPASDSSAAENSGTKNASSSAAESISNLGAPNGNAASSQSPAKKAVGRPEETVFEHAGRKTLRDLFLLHLAGSRSDSATEQDILADYTRHKDQDSFRISATNLGEELHENRKAYLTYAEKPEVMEALDRLSETGMLLRDGDTYTLTSSAPRRMNLTEDETLRLLQRIHSLGGAYSFSDELKDIADRLSLAFYREADETGKEFRTVGFRRIRMPQLEQDLEKLRGIPFSTRLLSVTYQTGEFTRTFSFLTGLFFYAADKRRLYLIGKEPGKEYDTTLICSRILDIRAMDEENTLFQNPYYMRMYDEMFSVSTEPAEKVSVEFERVFNVEEKLERLRRTRRYAKVTRTDSAILYEDTVRGMADFFKYLRSFGKSVKILGPASLQKLALDSAERILTRYGETIDQNDEAKKEVL